MIRPPVHPNAVSNVPGECKGRRFRRELCCQLPPESVSFCNSAAAPLQPPAGDATADFQAGINDTGHERIGALSALKEGRLRGPLVWHAGTLEE